METAKLTSQSAGEIFGVQLRSTSKSGPPTAFNPGRGRSSTSPSQDQITPGSGPAGDVSSRNGPSSTPRGQGQVSPGSCSSRPSSSSKPSLLGPKPSRASLIIPAELSVVSLSPRRPCSEHEPLDRRSPVLGGSRDSTGRVEDMTPEATPDYDLERHVTSRDIAGVKVNPLTPPRPPRPLSVVKTSVTSKPIRDVPTSNATTSDVTLDVKRSDDVGDTCHEDILYEEISSFHISPAPPPLKPRPLRVPKKSDLRNILNNTDIDVARVTTTTSRDVVVDVQTGSNNVTESSDLYYEDLPIVQDNTLNDVTTSTMTSNGVMTKESGITGETRVRGDRIDNPPAELLPALHPRIRPTGGANNQKVQTLDRRGKPGNSLGKMTDCNSSCGDLINSLSLSVDKKKSDETSMRMKSGQNLSDCRSIGNSNVRSVGSSTKNESVENRAELRLASSNSLLRLFQTSNTDRRKTTTAEEQSTVRGPGAVGERGVAKDGVALGEGECLYEDLNCCVNEGEEGNGDDGERWEKLEPEGVETSEVVGEVVRGGKLAGYGNRASHALKSTWNKKILNQFRKQKRPPTDDMNDNCHDKKEGSEVSPTSLMRPGREERLAKKNKRKEEGKKNKGEERTNMIDSVNHTQGPGVKDTRRNTVVGVISGSIGRFFSKPSGARMSLADVFSSDTSSLQSSSSGASSLHGRFELRGDLRGPDVSEAHNDDDDDEGDDKDESWDDDEDEWSDTEFDDDSRNAIDEDIYANHADFQPDISTDTTTFPDTNHNDNDSNNAENNNNNDNDNSNSNSNKDEDNKLSDNNNSNVNDDNNNVEDRATGSPVADCCIERINKLEAVMAPSGECVRTAIQRRQDFRNKNLTNLAAAATEKIAAAVEGVADKVPATTGMSDRGANLTSTPTAAEGGIGSDSELRGLATAKGGQGQPAGAMSKQTSAGKSADSEGKLKMSFSFLKKRKPGKQPPPLPSPFDNTDDISSNICSRSTGNNDSNSGNNSDSDNVSQGSKESRNELVESIVKKGANERQRTQNDYISKPAIPTNSSKSSKSQGVGAMTATNKQCREAGEQTRAADEDEEQGDYEEPEEEQEEEYEVIGTEHKVKVKNFSKMPLPPLPVTAQTSQPSAAKGSQAISSERSQQRSQPISSQRSRTNVEERVTQEEAVEYINVQSENDDDDKGESEQCRNITTASHVATKPPVALKQQQQQSRRQQMQQQQKSETNENLPNANGKGGDVRRNGLLVERLTPVTEQSSVQVVKEGLRPVPPTPPSQSTPALPTLLSPSGPSGTPVPSTPSLSSVSATSRSPPLPNTPVTKEPADLTTSAAESQEESSSQSSGGTMDEVLYSNSWYFGSVDRKECETRLLNMAQEGAFMVRRSQRGGDANPYAITVYHQNNVYNLLVRRRRDDGLFALGSEKPDETKFSDLSSLISFHRNNRMQVIASGGGGEAGSVYLTVSPCKQ